MKLLIIVLMTITAQTSLAEQFRKCVVDVQGIVSELDVLGLTLRQLGAIGKGKKGFISKWSHYSRSEWSSKVWTAEDKYGDRRRISSHEAEEYTKYENDNFRNIRKDTWVNREARFKSAPDKVDALRADFSADYKDSCKEFRKKGKLKKTCTFYFSLQDQNGRELDREVVTKRTTRVGVQYLPPKPKIKLLEKLVARNQKRCR